MCKTPYQLLVATRIAFENHANEQNDVIIFDTIASVDDLLTNIKDSKVFNSVFLCKTKRYFSTANNRFAKLYNLLLSYLIRIKVTPNGTIYDCIYVANRDWDENRIFQDIKKGKRHKKVQIYMYEDGLSTYSTLMADFFKGISSHKGPRAWLAQYKYEMYYNIKSLYVFSPELLEWEPDFNVAKIGKISKNDVDYISKLNAIFGYRKICDSYDEKIIFFEESYFAEGIGVDDISPVKYIAEKIGKENLLVKIHPRNPYNRLENLGIKTNKNTSVPWEDIAINIDLKDKILVTIASSSVLSALVNMNTIPKKIIILHKCKEFDNVVLAPGTTVQEKISENYSQIIEFPKSFEEMISIIKDSM